MQGLAERSAKWRERHMRPTTWAYDWLPIGYQLTRATNTEPLSAGVPNDVKKGSDLSSR